MNNFFYCCTCFCKSICDMKIIICAIVKNIWDTTSTECFPTSKFTFLDSLPWCQWVQNWLITCDWLILIMLTVSLGTKKLSSIWVRTAALIDVFPSIGRQVCFCVLDPFYIECLSGFLQFYMLHFTLSVYLVSCSFTCFISEEIVCAWS